MTEPTKWPPYPIGPNDSIFAMGVASVKFTELESVLRFIFGTVFELDSSATDMLPAKIGNEAAAILIEQRLERVPWKEPAKGYIEHFLNGFAVCLENRNYLVHSNVAWTGTESIVLFRTTKQGLTQGAVPTLGELRAVADDMHTYVSYGRMLGNAINNARSDPPIFPVSAFPWPGKPALPRKLQYSSDPLQLR